MRPGTVGSPAQVAGPPERAGWYALVLVVVAPFLAETVASANTPAVLFPVVLLLYVVVYGCPAVLLREMWASGRLTGPRLLFFGIGYTAFNEGVVAATWFKLSPGTGKVLAFTSVQAGHVAGVNWAVTAGLVVFHTVYSLIVPVTVVQALAVVRGRGSGGRPWVGRKGLAACYVLVGLVLLGSLSPKATAQACHGPALATCSAGRPLAAALVVLVALVLAFLPRPRRSGVGAQPSARPDVPVHDARRLLAGTAFGVAFFSAFFVLPLAGLPGPAVAADVLLFALVAVMAGRWCRPWGRDLRGDVLMTLGALVPGMVLSLASWQVGQPVAALLALALYRYLLSRLPRQRGAPVGPPMVPWPGDTPSPKQRPV